MNTGQQTPAQIAMRLDSDDALKAFRSEFYSVPGQIYLDGNSLGLLSRRAERAVLQALDDWKRHGVEGWTHGETPWFFLAETLGARTAPLIGADADEVVVTNSTTVNLHQLTATLFHPKVDRNRILADALAFPTDLYALQSGLRLRGLDPQTHLLLVPSRDGVTLDEAELIAAMTEEIQIAILPSVLYGSGQLLDMALLTREAHRRDIQIGFDCSHSIGAVPHQLTEWGVDFAFWCGYKYLSGGPGSAGGLYLNRRHFGLSPGLAGWFGSRKDRQFEMSPEQEPAFGAGALQIGTPNILSMAPLLGALELISEAGLSCLRSKSLALTRFLMELADSELNRYGFRVVTPREDQQRGGHVALQHSEAARIARALRRAGVIPDYRPPDILRLAPVALYVTFCDCLEAVERLKRIMEERLWEQIGPDSELVT